MERFFLCILIIFFCACIGRLKSKKLKLRAEAMSEMKEILVCLHMDMKNEMMTITQALIKESNNARVFSRLLQDCARHVKEKPGKPFYEIWEDEILKQVKNDNILSLLNKEETELLRKTGKSLVNASMHTQEAYFKMLYQDYDSTGQKIKSEAEKKTKLYHSLSLMAGFFIAILLI
jgi:stage III sporulation protein AB